MDAFYKFVLPPIKGFIISTDTAGTQKHSGDTKTREGHKDTGGTQRRRRDTKTREGEITHRHFRRIRGELTDQKDFIRGDH